MGSGCISFGLIARVSGNGVQHLVVMINFSPVNYLRLIGATSSYRATRCGSSVGRLEIPPSFALCLPKGERSKVRSYWDCSQTPVSPYCQMEKTSCCQRLPILKSILN